MKAPAPSLNRRAAGLALAAVPLGLTTGCATQVAAPGPAGLRGDEVLRRLALGSCADQTKPQPIWASIRADKPDAFIFGGDNVYYNAPAWTQAGLRAAYEQLAAQTEVQKLLAEVPHLEIWDDNDYGANDGGADFAHKQASKDEFLRFFKVPENDPRRSRPGLYREQLFGPEGQRVQVIVLDCRWFRSPLKVTDQRNAPGKERYLPDADPDKTMLGAEQWRWLESRLEVPAQLRFIVSGVQVMAEGHGWECWGNLPRERERLVELVARKRASGVVFLSGDRHIGAIYKRPATTALGGSYPLYEVTSSGLTHAWAQAKEASANRIGELITSNHYSVVDIDWAQRALNVQFKGEKGELLRSQTIAFSELRA